MLYQSQHFLVLLLLVMPFSWANPLEEVIKPPLVKENVKVDDELSSGIVVVDGVAGAGGLDIPRPKRQLLGALLHGLLHAGDHHHHDYDHHHHYDDHHHHYGGYGGYRGGFGYPYYGGGFYGGHGHGHHHHHHHHIDYYD